MITVIAFVVKTADSSIVTRPSLTLTRCAAILLISTTSFPFTMAAASAAPGARTAEHWFRSEVRCALAIQPNPRWVGTHYDVRLIQVPRASNSLCGSAGPGVAVGGLDSDGVGRATTTLQDSIRPGTTGVWVFIQRPTPITPVPVTTT